MPLEAFAAVGLAGNIVQFIDFLCNLFAETREIHNSASGLSDTSADLENIATDLKTLIASLVPSNSPTNSPVTQKLTGLAGDISRVADDLLDAIEKLKCDKPLGKRKSLLQAILQKFGKREKIEKVARRLGQLQQQLNTHLLSMMKDQSSDVSKAIQHLIDESNLMQTNTTQTLQTLEAEIVSHIGNLHAKAPLCDSKIEDLFKEIGRLNPVSARDVAELSNRMHHLFCALSEMQKESEYVSKDQKLLRSLHFKTIRLREFEIPKAHARTFEWMFSEDREGSKFLKWLEHGNGVFWAMGKAGSGKSTLMKFLLAHPLTTQALAEWAKGKELVVAQHFFWNAGTTLQKSQEGLLRSLLFEILRKCPQMISQILTSQHEQVDEFEREVGTWDVASLSGLFRRLSKQTEMTTKFCFFIDGLDEYAGKEIDLIKALRTLSKSPMIKLCVSSRPRNAFQDAYGGSVSQKLRLEDLTRDDIALYVKDTLEAHDKFDALRKRDSRYEELVQQIVDKAEGVFLWVFLVLQSLLNGLTNADRMSDLQRRIELLPETLEEYFGHMLDSVEGVYRAETFKAFKRALNAPPSGPIPLIVFSYLDEEDPDFALNKSTGLFSEDELKMREEDMKRRLDGRTRGLLEATPRRSSSDIPTVRFLHRTARDYLSTEGMLETLVKDVDVDLDSDGSLCKAFLAQMKFGPLPGRFSTVPDPLDAVLYYAHRIEQNTKKPANTVIDEVEAIVSKPSPWTKTVQLNGDFLGHAVSNNLRLYVTEKLAESSRIIKKSNVPILHVCLQSGVMASDPATQHYLNAQMVELLLSKGSKPNENLTFTSTVWTEFMSAVNSRVSGFWRDPEAVLKTLELLIANGADLEIPVQIRALSGKSGLDSGSYREASKIIRDCFPEHANWLLKKSWSPTSYFGGSLSAWPSITSFFRYRDS